MNSISFFLLFEFKMKTLLKLIEFILNDDAKAK